MKPSVYNITVDLEDGTTLLYNSASGKLVKMEREQYEEYINMFNSIMPSIKDSAPMNEFKNQLRLGHFIVEDDLDELNYVKAQHYLKRYSSGVYHLEIAPSGSCNMACSYCYYGNHEYENMSYEVETQLLATVKSVFKNKGKLNVTWVGGEPTLAVDTLCRLSRGFIKIAKKEKASYAGAIITNGYLLNRKMALNLKRYGIKMAQITVDGPPEVHDKRRPLKNGEGTFDVIMKNIREISDILPIVLRINIDKTNANKENIIKILDIMDEMSIPRHVTIDFGWVQPRTSSCSCYGIINGFNRQEYARALVELLPLVLERGYDFLFNGMNLSPYFGACPSCGNDCIAISSKGDMYKCLVQLGDTRESFGNLLSPISISNRVIKWLTWDPFEQKECRKCNVLPLCMGGGGCAFPYASLDGSCRNELRCMPFKFEIDQIIKLYYKKVNSVDLKLKYSRKQKC